MPPGFSLKWPPSSASNTQMVKAWYLRTVIVSQDRHDDKNDIDNGKQGRPKDK